MARGRRFSSDVKYYRDDDLTDGYSIRNNASARSRFKEIPTHPSIMEYIQRIGVGRQGKGNRKKKHPYGKKKKAKNRKNGGEHHQLYGDFDTMSREEERLFFGNRRVARRSGVGNSSSRSDSGQKQSLLPIVSPVPPPPFGDGHGNDNFYLSKTAKERNIRVLPVKVLGRVTPSSCGKDSNDDIGAFPRSTSGLPEVAIVGRSNVGKSTLLNALLYSGRSIEKEESEPFVRRRNKRLRSKIVTSQTARLPKGIKAKISSKPGETRSIDFYQLSTEIVQLGSKDDKENEDTKRSFNNKDKHSNGAVKKKQRLSLLLVDLPGYGFAFGPKKERRQPESDDSDGANFLFPWQSLIETYITNRPRSSLKRVLLLLDARHGMKQADSQFLEDLQMALVHRQKIFSKTSVEHHQQPRVPTELPPLQIVLTKCDLVSQVDLARRVIQVREQLSDCLLRQPKILPEMLVSARIEGQGGVLELQKELASLCGGGDIQHI